MKKNNKEFSNQMFTWSLDKSGQGSDNSSSNEDMSEAELFQMLLGEEAKQAALTGSDSSDDMMPQAPQSSTSKLDFRPVHQDIPESQLETLSTKEKRQLRNKISARNFRNRRKEYISNIEDELTLQKNENVQLKLEIKWLKNKMEKMQKENDKLRLDLMLVGTIQSQSPPQMMPQQPAFLLDSTTLLNPALHSSASSDESTLSSPPNLFTDFPDNWDFVLPTETTNNDTFLSHALVPDWNINQVLSKETSHFVTAPNVFQKYPLLAPALMSIVISHTMNMSTDEILATAKLSPPSLLPPPYSKPNVMSKKEANAAWDILEPLRQMEERNARLKLESVQEKTQEQDDKEEEEVEEHKEEVVEEDDNCPLLTLKQYVCRYIGALMQHYLSCQNDNKNNSNTGRPEERFSLCRKFKSHISAC